MRSHVFRYTWESDLPPQESKDGWPHLFRVGWNMWLFLYPIMHGVEANKSLMSSDVETADNQKGL